jgi:hypothetical protein
MDRPKWTDVAIVFLTVGIIFLGFMQWREMHEGGIDTHALAVAALVTEKSAEKSAQASRDFADSAANIGIKIGTAEQDFSRMAKNSADSIKATQDAMQVEQRPWVTVDNADDKGIAPYGLLQVAPAANRIGAVFDNTTAQFYMTYLLKNYGHAPANVDVNTEVVDEGYPKDKDMLKTVQKFCAKDRIRAEASAPWPLTIVPGTMLFNLPRELKITPKMRERGSIKPSVVGCIWYRSTIGDKSTHSTQFAGHVYWVPERNPARPPRGLEIPLSSGNIAPENLKVLDVLIMGKAN